MLCRFVIDEVIDEYRPCIEDDAGPGPGTDDPRR